MKHPFLRSLVFVLSAVSGIAVCSGAENKKLTIATGGTGGVYFPLGGAVASVLNAHLPVTARHESTSASADNVRLLVSGKADIAFVQADVTWDAYKGYGKFAQSQPIRTIAVFYPEALQVVTLSGSGIGRINDLRGKRVSTGAAGSGVEIWANRLLEANGVNPDTDVQRSRLLIGPSVEALKKREIDAFVWSGGVPTKAIDDLTKELGARVALLDTASAVPSMLRKYGPVYTDGDIAGGTYNGIKQPVKVAQVWNLLVVRADMDEKLAYDIAKTLFENKADLAAAHAMGKQMEMQNQARGGSPIPFHPGARKYFRENGVRILR